MKKILFLQNMGDAVGGILNVNKTLADCFNKNGDTCFLYSMRNGGYYNNVDTSEFQLAKIINKKDEWGLIKGKEIIEALKQLRLIYGVNLFIKRINYKIKLRKDFNVMKQEIINLKPDIIINSHYELLDAIPVNYLSKTIMHYHTNFDTVKNNNSCQKYFNKYKDKLGKFIWLTKSTCDAAKKFGFKNSEYIYNPVRIASKTISNVNKNKTLIFLGRISKEKRVKLLLSIFNDITKEAKYSDWKLNIYGIGEMDEESQKIIINNKQIINHGPTDDIKSAFLKSSINLNTSEFEGFSMTILEGNECGVPTLSFNFGETIKEQIKDKKTGIIIKQDDINSYKSALQKLMDDPIFLQELSVNCKEFSKKFKVSTIFEKWLDIIEIIEKK